MGVRVVKTASRANLQEASGDGAITCLPSRLLWVRISSPALFLRSVSLLALLEPFQDKQAMKEPARRRFCFWEESVQRKPAAFLATISLAVRNILPRSSGNYLPSSP